MTVSAPAMSIALISSPRRRTASTSAGYGDAETMGTERFRPMRLMLE